MPDEITVNHRHQCILPRVIYLQHTLFVNLNTVRSTVIDDLGTCAWYNHASQGSNLLVHPVKYNIPDFNNWTEKSWSMKSMIRHFEQRQHNGRLHPSCCFRALMISCTAKTYVASVAMSCIVQWRDAILMCHSFWEKTVQKYNVTVVSEWV